MTLMPVITSTANGDTCWEFNLWEFVWYLYRNVCVNTRQQTSHVIKMNDSGLGCRLQTKMRVGDVGFQLNNSCSLEKICCTPWRTLSSEAIVRMVRRPSALGLCATHWLFSDNLRLTVAYKASVYEDITDDTFTQLLVSCSQQCGKPNATQPYLGMCK
ncbi:hypothetical protein CDAR_201471 [Caerostris darwini]|uniref:Uncharacterized protein n=1 Tax=Caerostris darwini TaxID=1538125 RepID=A0AAV4WHK7_9ARAC|nr:hypothetical protein CDAR_201471 [Caerostris darwini]